MNIKKRLPAFLLAVLMLFLTPALVAGAEDSEDDGEPTYIVQLHSSVEKLIPSLGNNLKLKIGEVYEKLPKEGDNLFSDVTMVYPGHTLVGYAAYVWGGAEQLFYKEGSEGGVPLDEATIYGAPANLVEEDPVQYKPTFVLREGMLNDTPLGPRADVWAVWKKDPHELTFTMEDGTRLLSMTAVANQVVTLPEPPADALREGFDFMWSWGGLNYGPGQEYVLPGYADKSKVVEFEATYVRKQYQFNITYVTFDKNGNSEKVSSVSYSGLPDSGTGTVTYAYGTSLSSILPAPKAREGFAFGGWYRDEACTALLTDADTANALYQAAYAKWTPVDGYKFRIAFEGMDAFEVAYGDILTIPQAPESLTATHVGYTFGGWSTGSMLYVPDQKVRVTESLTMTAAWDENLLDLILKEGSGSPKKSAHIEGEQIYIGVRSKAGYRFVGWFDENGTLVSADGSFTMPGNDLTLEARFEQESFLVSLVQDGKNSEHRVKNGESMTLPTPERTGYRFVGWTGDGVQVTGQFTPTADTVLTALFEELTYTLTYTNNLNSQTYTETVKYSERESVTLRDADVPGGYRFLGYTDETGKTVEGDKISLDGDKTLCAIYAPLTLTVKWVNPATGKTESQTVEMGSALTLPDAPETPEGYRFIGWYNEKGEKVENGSEIGAATVLTAKFEADGTAEKGGFEKYLWIVAIGAVAIGAVSFLCFLLVRTPSKKVTGGAKPAAGTNKSAVVNGKHTDATGKRAGTNGQKTGK